MKRNRRPTFFARARLAPSGSVAALVTLATLALAPAAHADDPAPYWEDTPAEIGARVGFMELEDGDSGQTLPTGGLGGYFRYRFGRRIGMEAAIDAYISDQLGRDTPGEVVSVTVPITASALFYLFPDSDFSLYILGGLGVAANSVSYDALGEQATWATPVAQLGIGAQLRFDDTLFDLSFRSLMMHRSQGAVEITPLEQAYDLRQVDYVPRTDARAVVGAMVTLGIHFAL